MGGRALLLLSLSWALCARAGAADQDPDTEVARRHFQRGSELYLAEKYDEAAVEFEAAREIHPDPAMDFNLARCYDRAGHWEKALAGYQRYLAAVGDAPDAKEAAARVTILQERVNKKKAGAPVIVAPGMEPLVPPPTPSAPPAEPPRPLSVAVPLAGALLAVAAAGAGIGLYLSVKPDVDTLRTSCAPNCARSQWEGLQTREQAGIGLLIAAGTVAVVDVVLWVIFLRGSPAARTALAPLVRF